MCNAIFDWRMIKLGIAVFIASLLMVAGVTKTYSSSIQLVHMGFEVHEVLLVSLAICELTLGGILFRNFNSQLPWILVGGVFSLFAVYSGMDLEKQSPCGCMGNVEVDRNYMVVLNVIVAVVSGGVAILGWLKPSGLLQGITWAWPSLLSTGAVSVIFLSVFLQLFQMLPTDQPFTTNKYVSVDEYAPETGHFTCVARVCNKTSHDVRFLGVKPQCGVNCFAKFPIVFKPGRCHEISIVSKMPAGKSWGEISIEYYADINGRLIEDDFFFTVDLGKFETVVVRN